MDREELVGIQTIWWVDYQLAVGFLTGSWKSNMDVWISNQLFGNPTACLSWPRCNGELQGGNQTRVIVPLFSFLFPACIVLVQLC